VTILIIVAIVGLVFAATAAMRRPKPPQPPDPYAVLPEFRVIALGPSGSGKTVLLSSMFHELGFFSDQRAYYLTTNAPDMLLLNNLYREVSDPTRPWPRATGRSTVETKEYQFDCVGRDLQGRPHPVAQISYLDFAGALVEDDSDVDDESFAKVSKAIAKASALLVLIDGRRVRQLLDNDPEGDHYFRFTLPSTLGFAQSVSCPVHLVLTKWDLVQDFAALRGVDDETRLERVVDVLMEYPQLAGLVRMQHDGQTVRIIPVSSVGRSFVSIDTNGRVVKKPEGTIKPTNVVAPLAAVVPDFFQQVEITLDPKTHKALTSQPGGSRAFLSWLTSVTASPAGIALRGVLVSLIGIDLAGTVNTLFLDYLAREDTHQDEGRPGPRNEAEREIAEMRELRARVLRDFTSTVQRLEALYPSSLLRVATRQG